MKKNFQIIKEDCVVWMNKQSSKSIDCIITSPPYNLSIKYGAYDDSIPRANYLKWMEEVACSMKNVLKDNGQLYLNVGYSNVDPFVAMDVAQVFRKYFILQNQFTWVKHIAVNDVGYGQYKPITSKRFASVTNESIFHFTKNGLVEVDRCAIGQRNLTHPIWPELYSEGRHIANTRRKIARKLNFENYKDITAKGNDDQKKEFNKLVKKMLEEKPYEPTKKKCIGNVWFIPYTPTSKLSKQIGVEDNHNSRKNSRADHPATFPPKLPEQCIKFSGIKKGSIVYDPFLGTGTTLVAAKKLGMLGIGTDISDEYINFAKKRIALDKEDTKEEKIKIKNLVLKNNPKKQLEIKFN
jgi:site-specific DNA-methyltransferase (adenine-specific)